MSPIRSVALAEIAQLVAFQENPPNNLTHKSLPPQAQSITMVIHVHAQEWLTLITITTTNKNEDSRPTTPTLKGKVQEKRSKRRRLE